MVCLISCDKAWIVGKLIALILLLISIFRQGGLRERDQLLAIDGQPLDISHQEAIKILQSAGGLVQIVVARGSIPTSPQAPGDLPESPDTQTGQQNINEVTDMVSALCMLDKEYSVVYVKDSKRVYTGYLLEHKNNMINTNCKITAQA
mgnify:CR=1 FL=1